jgi:hypothetical protein
MRGVGAKQLLGVALVALLALDIVSTAAADPSYEVMNAPEGVYWRSEPNWAAAERITGFGVYDGTIVEVHCYQSGTAVEGSADTMWEQASDVGGRGYGAGWLNEHFINDGQPINQSSPGVPPCNAAPPPAPPPPPTPAPTSGLVFTVFNAEGGIYYRNSPHVNDTPQSPGVGVYNGDQVELICGATGDPVGPYSDTAWSKVKNLTRPGIGEGWVNEHYVNDGASSGAWPPGESICLAAPGLPANPGQGGGSSGPNSVFYSPNATPNGVASIRELADLNLPAPQWAVGGCSPAAAASIPAGVSTLAGWSVGRLGPVYFLAAATSAQKAAVHRIVLFDPGATADFTGSCDPRIDINGLLARWLSANPANHLLVLTGYVSEMHSAGQHGRSTYAGLWKYYFAGIWNQPFASRAQVCDYESLEHDRVLIDFASVVNHPPLGCPPAPNVENYLTAWNP